MPSGPSCAKNTKMISLASMDQDHSGKGSGDIF